MAKFCCWLIQVQDYCRLAEQISLVPVLYVCLMWCMIVLKNRDVILILTLWFWFIKIFTEITTILIISMNKTKTNYLG